MLRLLAASKAAVWCFQAAHPVLRADQRWLFVRIHMAACDRVTSEALLRVHSAHLGGAGAGDLEAGLEDMITQKDAWKPFWAREVVGNSINSLYTSYAVVRGDWIGEVHTDGAPRVWPREHDATVRCELH